MKKIKMRIALAILITLSVIYITSYFAVSDIFVGEFSGKMMKIRLFQRNCELSFYHPMIYLEAKLRNETFYAQVRSGASLPPEAKEDENEGN